ncbi:MAG: OmpH family outer membrane protein [Bacteroidia bacterium]
MQVIKRLFIPALFVVAFSAIGFSVFLFATRPKIAYVDLAKVYNGFELKKQLETQLKVVQQVRQRTLDSLELGLKMISRNLQSIDSDKSKNEIQIKTNEFEALKQDYLYKQENFSSDNSSLLQQYDQQVWKQLNQYVKDYGEANGYTCILGGDGSGNVMYSSKGLDITEELIAYTNKCFKGETKLQ